MRKQHDAARAKPKLKRCAQHSEAETTLRYPGRPITHLILYISCLRYFKSPKNPARLKPD